MTKRALALRMLTKVERKGDNVIGLPWHSYPSWAKRAAGIRERALRRAAEAHDRAIKRKTKNKY